MLFFTKKIFFLIRLFIWRGIPNFAAKFLRTKQHNNSLLNKNRNGRKEIFDMRW